MKILDKSFTFYKKRGGEFSKEVYLYLLTRKSNVNIYNDITKTGKLDVKAIDKCITYNLLFSTNAEFEAIEDFKEIEMPEEVKQTLDLYNTNYKF